MNTDDYIKNVETAVIELSKQYNGNEEVCYPYAFGYFVSQLRYTLMELNLSKNQLKILESRLNVLTNNQEIYYVTLYRRLWTC